MCSADASVDRVVGACDACCAVVFGSNLVHGFVMVKVVSGNCSWLVVVVTCCGVGNGGCNRSGRVIDRSSGWIFIALSLIACYRVQGEECAWMPHVSLMLESVGIPVPEAHGRGKPTFAELAKVG